MLGKKDIDLFKIIVDIMAKILKIKTNKNNLI